MPYNTAIISLISVCAGATITGVFYTLNAWWNRRAKQRQNEGDEPREVAGFWQTQFAALRDENGRLEARIAQLEMQVAQMTDGHNQERLEWARSIGLRDTRIQAQEGEIERQKAQIDLQQREIGALKDEVTRLRGRVASLENGGKS